MSSLPGVGMFGTGVTAKAVSYLLKASGFRIEAVWGKTEDEAKEVAAQLDIPFCTSHIDDLLLNQKVNLVCIYSPPLLQSEIAVKTLGIGKNVLCSRPAGLNCEDTERMLQAAKYYPSLMSIITFYLRFLPTFCEMKKLVDSGTIGDLRIIEIRVHCNMNLELHYGWFHDGRTGGGMLSSLGGHFIDLVTFISGQRAVKVHGFLQTFQKSNNDISGFREITSDDFCSFEMKLDKKTFCTCIINNNVPGPFSYEVFAIGSKACLLAKDGLLTVQAKLNGKIGEKKVILEDETCQLPVGLETLFPPQTQNQIPIPFIQGLLKFIYVFKQAFTDKTDQRMWDQSAVSSAATFEDALYVQNVLSSIRKSSQSFYWEQV